MFQEDGKRWRGGHSLRHLSLGAELMLGGSDSFWWDECETMAGLEDGFVDPY